MVTDCLTEEAAKCSPDTPKSHRRHTPHADLHLSQKYGDRSAKEIERLLREVQKDAIYIEDFAMEMSRERKRPVLILCNARSGSYFHPAIINGLERLVEPAERDEFASEVAENLYWKQPGGKRRAMFETAQRWIEQDRMLGFIYSTREIKICSCDRRAGGNPVMATPHGLDELIESGCDIVFADYSKNEFPGSFASFDENFWSDAPGFKEFLEEKSKKYKVFLGSRRQKKRGQSPDTCFKKALRARGPVAVCLNALKGTPGNDSDVYNLADNSPALLGEFGQRMGHGYSFEDFTPEYIQTSAGEMELDVFVRQYLRAR